MLHWYLYVQKSKNNPNTTLLFYNHYDVQPVEPLELWDDPPFSGKIIGNKIFGRGASDDKGEYKNALIQAYEIQQPYSLIVVLHFSETSHCRLDITSEALAEELRNWMDGSLLNHPAYLAIPRTNEVMDRYIKFSKPPGLDS